MVDVTGIGTVLSALSDAIGANTSSGGILAEGFLSNIVGSDILINNEQDHVYEVSVVLTNPTAGAITVNLYQVIVPTGLIFYNLVDANYNLLAGKSLRVDGLVIGFTQGLKGDASAAGNITFTIFGTNRIISR